MFRELIVLGALAGTATAAPRAESASFGGHSVVIPAKKLAFVMIEEKRIPKLVAVDLATGKRRWTSTTAVKPIIARGDALVALDGAGHVLVLDVRTGKRATKCGAITTVTAPFMNGLGLNQSAFGYDDGASLYLSWTSDTFYSGGAAPTPDEEAQSRHHSATIWSLDLATCSATVAKALPTIDMPTVDATRDVVTATGGTARIERDAKAGTATLVPAKSKTPIDLTEGNRARTLVAVSVDRRFVACGDAAKTMALFDLDTGAVTHPSYFHASYAWLNLGKTIISGAGALIALDAATGKVLWTVVERSTAYMGPYPP